MVHLISVNLILVHLFMVHIILDHTLWIYFLFFFHGSHNTHGSHKVCEPVNHGSHVTHAPKVFEILKWGDRLKADRSKKHFFRQLKLFS
jgi:hypothetical protein